MALKDWKKVANIYNVDKITTWEYLPINPENKGRYSNIQITKADTNSSCIKNVKIGYWYFFNGQRGIFEIPKEFKTKSQALKFAKSYMRTH